MHGPPMLYHFACIAITHRVRGDGRPIFLHRSLQAVDPFFTAYNTYSLILFSSARLYIYSAVGELLSSDPSSYARALKLTSFKGTFGCAWESDDTRFTRLLTSDAREWSRESERKRAEDGCDILNWFSNDVRFSGAHCCRICVFLYILFENLQRFQLLCCIVYY